MRIGGRSFRQIRNRGILRTDAMQARDSGAHPAHLVRSGANLHFGDAGNDRLTGGPGDDKLFGGAGIDRLVGGPGNDVLNGGKGKDLYFGGSGNDTINSRDGVAETVDCGAGKDTVKADKKDRLKHCEKVSRR